MARIKRRNSSNAINNSRRLLPSQMVARMLASKAEERHRRLIREQRLEGCPTCGRPLPVVPIEPLPVPLDLRVVPMEPMPISLNVVDSTT